MPRDEAAAAPNVDETAGAFGQCDEFGTGASGGRLE